MPKAAANHRFDGRDHRRQATLHVGGAASIQPPVSDLASAGVTRPAPSRGDGVRVAVEDQVRTSPGGSQPSQEVGTLWLDVLDLACQTQAS